MYAKPELPQKPDHFATLGVSPDDSNAVLKKAYHKLALKCHPDKTAPGAQVDESKFKKVLEAYEVLTDSEKRQKYEREGTHEKWAQYRRDMEDWQRRSAAEAAAEAERERHRSTYERQGRRRMLWAMGEYEKARRVASAKEAADHEVYGHLFEGLRRCGCTGCEARRIRKAHERRNGVQFPTEAEYDIYLEMRREEAERREREATEKRRQEQEREARERMRKEQERAERNRAAAERKRAAKQKVKEDRSNETARRAREQQEKDAQLRMAKNYLLERQEKHLRMLQEQGRQPEDCAQVMELDWIKTKGVAKCLFCEEDIMYYSFRCPEGGAIACNPCKNKMSRFMPAREASDGEDLDEEGYGTAESSYDEAFDRAPGQEPPVVDRHEE